MIPSELKPQVQMEVPYTGLRTITGWALRLATTMFAGRICALCLAYLAGLIELKNAFLQVSDQDERLRLDASGAGKSSNTQHHQLHSVGHTVVAITEPGGQRPAQQ